MSFNRVMIAAAKSGSGKTLITCGLMRIFKEDGLKVAPFKCGPDYIDPMYHRAALGTDIRSLGPDGKIASGGNLDTFFTDEKTTKELLYEGGADIADISVIEGVMGLYDGLGGCALTGSSYELACVTKTPIILIIDAKGMGRSVLALIKGFLEYDTEKLICGVILNRVGRMFFNKLKDMVESELHIKVLGFVPEDERLGVKSRHLGLMVPEESLTDINDAIVSAGEILRETLDTDAIKLIAESAEKIDVPVRSETMPALPFFKGKLTERMAVASDEAFCFYYRENLRYLKTLGYELVPFSPLHDEGVPDGVNAILLGGGYPEEYLKGLSENASMLESIRSAGKRGVFIIAECGGFMYLQEAIEDREGKAYKMAGVLPGVCRWKGRLTRFGYVEAAIGNTVLKGHEFHYYDSDFNGTDVSVVKASDRKEYRAMYATDKLFAGYVHLYYRSACAPAF